MPADLFTLLQRDHVDLQTELTRLFDPTATGVQLASSLDGVRLGLTAHAEAEDIVLGRFEMVTALGALVAQARAAHVGQEGALSALVGTRPGTAAWRDRAYRLRELVHNHALQEQQYLMPALKRHARDTYAELAGAFATERLRQLAMLQPSAPFVVPDAAAS